MESVLRPLVATLNPSEDAVLFEGSDVFLYGPIANDIFWKIVELGKVTHRLAAMFFDECPSGRADGKLPLHIVQYVEPQRQLVLEAHWVLGWKQVYQVSPLPSCSIN